VDNISFGPAFVDAAAQVAKVPLDTHLMVTRPDHYFPRFIQNSRNITIHVEADCDVLATLKAIRQAGISCGLSLRPKTPFESMLPFLPYIDLLLVMTVEPGFGGQPFLTAMLEKVRSAQKPAKTKDWIIESKWTEESPCKQAPSVWNQGPILWLQEPPFSARQT
jgi:ribulose-phosphate 3-epimerase